MKTLSTKKQGFTIIEVVLVLAIAGLIFLMVFVALPSMQRSQRDTQRRSDMARLATALTNYQANNNNSLPGLSECSSSSSKKVQDIQPNTQSSYSGNVACTLVATYLNASTSSTNDFKDPDGTTYNIKITKKPKSSSSFDHNINISTKYKCDNSTTSSTNNPNDFVILYKLEGSGTICIDNQ